MPSTVYVADHDITTHVGGAEKVDYNIYSALNIPFITAHAVNMIGVSKDIMYVISNATMLTPHIRAQLIKNKNYIIVEHDYKIHPTRQPHRYPSNIFPPDERTNLDFYKNAQIVFLQSKDHLDCFKANGVEGNLYSLSTSIWDEQELETLYRFSTIHKSDYRYCVLANNTPDKGVDIAIAFCKQNNLDYVRMPELSLLAFYKELSKYSTLVYFPRVKESFCRLVVEARCLQMNVITTNNYGATKEEWFSRSGRDLIEFLRVRTKENLKLIKSYL